MKELDMSNYVETKVKSPKINDEIGNKITNITLTEAFEIGKDAGLKEAFTEVKKLTDSEFTKKFCETRISTLENNELFLNKFKRSLSQLIILDEEHLPSGSEEIHEKYRK